MAIPSKKEIDFDVYQRQDPASTVDWGKAAKDITTTFEGIRDTRQAKKDAIEKSYQDQQKALQDIGEYDNPTIQQFVMNGGQDAANKEQEFYNLVKRGLAKPADYTMFQHNLKTGFDLVKKNAEQFDNTFKEYTTRVQDGTGAPGEQWIAEQLEGFANMNNMSLQADPETGDMVMLRTDDEGNPIPGESMSVQRMTLLMKQQIDNFDIGKEVLAIKDEMGTVTTTMIRKQYGPNVVITKEMKSRAEEEFFGTKDGNDFLSLKVDQLTSSPYNVQSMIVNGNLTTPNGTKYEVGGEEDYDRWMEENGGDEKNNPYLVMEFGEDNLYKPKFNETQDKAAKEYARAQITGALDYSKEQSVKGLAQPRAATSSEIGLGDRKKVASVYIKNVDMVVSGSAAESAAGAQNLIDDINKNNPNAPRLTNIDRNVELLSEEQQEVKLNTFKEANPNATAEELEAEKNRLATEGKITDFTIKVDGQQDRIIDAYNDDGTLKSGQQLKREIYEKITPKGATKYDIAESDYTGDLSRGVGNTGAGGEGVKDKIVYKRMNVTNADGEEVSPSDYMKGELGSTLHSMSDPIGQVEQEFNKLMDMDEIMPRGLEGGGSLKIVNGNGVFTIGGQEFIYDNIYSEGDSVQDIVNFMQDSIETAVNNQNSGTTGSGGSSKGDGSKYN
jgi:hypothetical protein